MNARSELAELTNNAYRQYYNGAYKAAWDISAQGLARFPGSFDLIYLSGLVLARNGDAAAAEKLIEQARVDYPEVTKFDFTTDFLERYASPSKTAVWEYRLEEFQKHRLVENFILSYPKCGRTWVRYVLGTYASRADPEISPEDRLEVARLTAKDDAFPVTEFSHDDYPHARPPAEISQDKSIYAGKRVAFLVRDPRDVLVSFYFQYTRRGRLWEFGQDKFDGTLSEFIRQPAGGISSLVTYFNVWANHRADAKAVLPIRYEELLEDPVGEFTRLITFLEWPDFGAKAVRGAVAAGRFEEMHRLEAAGEMESVRVSAPESGDPEAFKTRRGVAGGYVDYLGQADVDYIDSYLEDNLDGAYDYYKR